METQQFFLQVKKAAELIKGIDTKEVLRIVTHLDADGLCASSIMIKALAKQGRKVSLSVVQQLSERFLQELSHEDYIHYLFLDLGSGSISSIKKHLKFKKSIIIDHHTPEGDECSDIVHINPHLCGIDGGTEISGAGVSYLVAREMDILNKDNSFLAVIGAIGDAQENNGFQGLNRIILSDAVESGMIETRKSLRLFGSQTRPLHKALELGTDVFVPGVTGSESGAIQFLHEIGIDPKNKGKWRTMAQLAEEEEKRLIAAIILRRAGEDEPENIFGIKYVLPNEPNDSLFYDAKEFSTMVNACGRLDKPSVGIGICLGSRKAKKKANDLLAQYKLELMNAMEWIKSSRSHEDITRGKGFLIINARQSIRPSLIGTIASMLSKSEKLRDDLVMVMGRDSEGSTKISFRASKRGIDLRSTLKEIVELVGGDFGGHMSAAGAVIDQSKENAFIAAAANMLEKKMMEERVY